MKPTQTGIAVALALVVVALFIMNPGLSPFAHPQTAASVTNDEAAAVGAAMAASTTNAAMPEASQPITQLMTKDEVVGTGAVAESGDTVTVNYVGQLTNGTVFDASAKHGTTGFTFKLGAGLVIAGWDQGIVGMKVGGKRLLAIPANLAYGDHAVGNVIPANSPLIFEVELLKVTK